MNKLLSTAVGIGTVLSSFNYVGAAQEKPEIAKDKDIEVIQVTGSLRKSFEGAIGIKRLADTVVDAISAENIGQFSDDSIAGALQRVPGVQIERDQAGTDGDRVSIRGLGPSFVNSTVNGRTLLSSGNEAAGLRKMNFNVFPSSVLSGVRIAKGQTAVRPESGLAGQVDLQTIRPLDLNQLNNNDYVGKVSYRKEYRDLAGDDGGLFEGSLAWKNEQETFGFFIGGVFGESDTTNNQYGQTRVERDLRVDTDGDGIENEEARLKGVSVPNAITSRPISQTITRNALSLGLQWQPTDDLDIIWDLAYAKFDNESQRHNGQIIMNPTWGGTVFSRDELIIDDNNVLRYADFSKSTAKGNILSRVQDMRFQNTTENLISGINIEWYLNQLTTTFDLYYSSVDYSQDLRFPILNKNLDKSQVIYDGRGEIPTLSSGADRLDPDGYKYLFSIVREIGLDGKNFGSTINFNYEVESDWLASVDFGLHYEKTDLDSVRSKAARYSNKDNAAAIADAALSGATTGEDFLADQGYDSGSWLASDFDAIAAIDPNVLNTGFDVLGVDPAASYQSVEEIFAAYGQINIDAEIFELPLGGNIGLRAVHTSNTATAATVGASAEPTPFTTKGDYWEYLPSINLNLALQDDLALRLGFSKTLSRPEYKDMAPIISVTIPAGDDNIGNGTATSGNPDLKPMTSFNYDITLEYYNESDGAAILSLFYKDVSDFIITDLQFDQTVPGQTNGLLFDTKKPINFSDGEVTGLEIGFYQPFDELFPALTGFGVSANYTYVDSSFDIDVGDSGFGFPGSSKNNYNLVGFYEQELFSVRLAYVSRDKFFRTLAGQGSQTSDARFTSGSETLDLNINVRPIDHVSIALNINNLTNDTRRDHIGDEAKFLDFFESGRTYSLTVSYNF